MRIPAGSSNAASNRCFVSAKARTPIRFAARIVHEALAQLTLDPAVRALEFVSSLTVSGVAVQLDVIVVIRADGRHRLDVVEARSVRDIDEEGLVLLAQEALALPALVMTPADLRREPYATNCCLVWNGRHVQVRASDRVRILQALTEDGPMPLGQLATEARWSHDHVGQSFPWRAKTSLKSI